MEFKELHRKLLAKEYAPLYLLHGEEPYFIDRITKEIEEHLLNVKEYADIVDFNKTGMQYEHIQEKLKMQ